MMIPVSDSDSAYSEFRDSVRSFVERTVTDEYIQACEAGCRPPTEVFRNIAAQGWLELGKPTSSEPLDFRAIGVLLEELAYGYLGLADLVYRALIHGASVIERYAQPSVRAGLLDRIVAGDLLCCNGLTEPDSGADAASITTKAVRQGSEYVINGHKIFNTGMEFVDYAVCYARTSNETKRHDGISALLVPAKSKGITVVPLDTVGMRSSRTCEVWYEDVHVPADALLAEEGSGWKVLVGHLDRERFGLASICVGSMRRVVEQAVEYAQQRKQFGRNIGQFQAVAHLLADMRISYEASLALTRNVSDKLMAGVDCRMDAAIAKCFVAEAYKQVSDSGLQIWGAYGYLFQSDINRHWRDSRLETIGGGSSQIMRDIIGKGMGLDILR